MKFKHKEIKMPKPTADEKKKQRTMEKDFLQREGVKRDPKRGKSYKK